MTKKMGLLFAAAVLGLVSGAAMAAVPSLLNSTGAFLTPDDALLGSGDFSSDYNSINLEGNPNILGAAVGVSPYIELGLARLDPDMPGAGVKTLLSGKYLVFAETANRPSFVAGCVDAIGKLASNGDPSFYGVFGKNLTSVATNISGQPSAPLRGYVGYGMGIYGGVFGGLDWTLGPRMKLMAEYINKLRIMNVVSEDSMINAGVRFMINDELSGDLALINGKDLAFGIKFVKISQ